jgi:hypothetical protein
MIRRPTSLSLAWENPLSTVNGDADEIVMRSRQPSPGSDENVAILFYPRSGAFVVGGTTFLVPRSLAERIAGRQSLR